MTEQKKNERLHADDPRLTAHALGETNPTEQAELEAAIAADPELARELAEIHEVGALLEKEFDGVEPVSLTDEQKKKVAAAAAPPVSIWRAPLRVAAAGLVGVGIWWIAQSDRIADDSSTGPSTEATARTAVEPQHELGDVESIRESAIAPAVDPIVLPVENPTPAPAPAPAQKPRTEQAATEQIVTVTRRFSEDLLAAGQTPVNRTHLRFDAFGITGSNEGTQAGSVDSLVRFAQPDLTELALQSGAHADSYFMGPSITNQTWGSFGQPTPGNLTETALKQFKDHLMTVTDGKVSGWSDDQLRLYYFNKQSAESYARIVENAFANVKDIPLSTFSIDVDTASYANMRRILRQGQLPPPDAIRIEEMLNYFSYNYPGPRGDRPFSVDVEVASCPWQTEHRLARIALRGRDPEAREPQKRNLVFLIDVSGSMDSPDKLPLLKRGMKLLTENLNSQDRVAIVTYAGESGCALEPTPCNERTKILDAIEKMSAGGSTNGEAGIQLAYQLAVQNFDKEGINRVILATDGDFNVGMSEDAPLTRLIEDKAKSGVFLSVLGFGTGNLKDSKMESLADHGNGNYAYIDSIREARKVLVHEIGATLETIAKDVKIQVEFNPAQVASYRLIGYENRALQAQDFNDDKKDAGEIGAGHRVTALYQIVPVGGSPVGASVDPLKYQKKPQQPANVPDEVSNELMTVKLRYKQPDGDTSQKIEHPVVDSENEFAKASTDFRFASAVAQFGLVLRSSQFAGSATLESAHSIAKESLGDDLHGYRQEFVELIEAALPMFKR